MSESASIPSSWSELLEQHRSRRAGLEKFIRGRATAMANANPGWLAGKFFSPAEALAQVSVTLGPDAGRPLFTPFEPYVAPVLKETAGGPTEKNRVGDMAVLHFVGVARCCGVALPPEAGAVEKDWLPVLATFQAELTEKESYSMAFEALALGAFDRVPTFIKGGALPASVTPGQTFQLNVQKFVRYLAAAAAGGAKADDVEPAFQEFVRVFPLKLGAESLQWVDLLNAARAYYVHFEKRPVESVAQTLHDFVTRVAASNQGS